MRQFESAGRPHVVRLAMPVKDYAFRDEVLGKDVPFPAAEVQDFVIRKTDGMPTFHFAVVVDDAEMGVTHVMRAGAHEEHVLPRRAAGGARLPAPDVRSPADHPEHRRLQDGQARPRQEGPPRGEPLAEEREEDAGRHRHARRAAAGADRGLAGRRGTPARRDRAAEGDARGRPARVGPAGGARPRLPQERLPRGAAELPRPARLVARRRSRAPPSIDEMVGLFSTGGIGKSNAKFGARQAPRLQHRGVRAAACPSACWRRSRTFSRSTPSRR